MVEYTFTFRSLQSLQPEPDFLSKGPRRPAEVLAESIEDPFLQLEFVIDLDSNDVETRRCEVAKMRKCEDAKFRILEVVVQLPPDLVSRVGGAVT
jgi:hypothetical protein